MLKKLSPEEILDYIHCFHGHIGPYVVLGYRAGLIASMELGDDPFVKRAVTFTGLKTPISCFTDGVQLGSCCTLGKGNIRVENNAEARVRFELKDGSRSLEISLTEDAICRITDAKDWEESEHLARKMFDEPEDSLFVIERE